MEKYLACNKVCINIIKLHRIQIVQAISLNSEYIFYFSYIIFSGILFGDVQLNHQAVFENRRTNSGRSICIIL